MDIDKEEREKIADRNSYEEALAERGEDYMRRQLEAVGPSVKYPDRPRHWFRSTKAGVTKVYASYADLVSD